jgi:steroid delta-isomerase-like uncharacterized protein
MSNENDNNKDVEENKNLAKKFIELTWNQGRFNIAGSMVRRDFGYTLSLMNQTSSYDGLVKVIQTIRDSMEDFEVMIESCIAESDQVVTQSSFCGALIKPMLGFQPSDKVVTFAAVSFWQFKKGRLQSLHTQLDLADLIRQMRNEGKNLELNISELVEL